MLGTFRYSPDVTSCYFSLSGNYNFLGRNGTNFELFVDIQRNVITVLEEFSGKG
jgi:hypothetical protein